MSLAPIALFTFKRPEHTRRTLEALARNPEFAGSPLHVFCDGARNAAEAVAVEQTRQVVRDFAHADKTVHEAPTNRGLATSIIAGVSMLCERFGRVIVVEDDLVVAPVFLEYMNGALERYVDESKVMQVSGHMFPVSLGSEMKSVLLPFTTSWGWATWQRAWAAFDPMAAGYARLRSSLSERLRFDLGGAYPYFRMLEQHLAGKNDSWAIRWYLSVFEQSGLVLFPTTTLVSNIGFDGSGTHSKNRQSDELVSFDPRVPDSKLDHIGVDLDAFKRLERYIAKDRGLLKRTADWAGRLVV